MLQDGAKESKRAQTVQQGKASRPSLLTSAGRGARSQRAGDAGAASQPGGKASNPAAFLASLKRLQQRTSGTPDQLIAGAGTSAGPESDAAHESVDHSLTLREPDLLAVRDSSTQELGMQKHVHMAADGTSISAALHASSSTSSSPPLHDEAGADSASAAAVTEQHPQRVASPEAALGASLLPAGAAREATSSSTRGPALAGTFSDAEQLAAEDEVFLGTLPSYHPRQKLDFGVSSDGKVRACNF
jgi:hypothetical protein